MRLLSCEKAMGSCTAECKTLPFCVKTVVKESGSFELARLVTFWCGSFAMAFVATLGVFLDKKTLERSMVSCHKAYTLTVFEILKDVFVLAYIVCPLFPYI